MSETLFKAVFHYSADEFLRQNGRSVGLLKRIQQWLDDEGRRDHYVMAYLNGTLDEDAAQLVVVLNDRDTALMLKLALA